MKIEIARHFGMCFGVRDALRSTHDLAQTRPVTVLGDLVHNPLVREHLDTLGVRKGNLDRVGEAGTEAVIITAHGAADSARRDWSESGHEVFDTTCPLVKKAHRSLECLVLTGYFPVVIGRSEHVEVKGLIADFSDAVVVSGEEDLARIPSGLEKIGVVSQTTQPSDRVGDLVEKIRERFSPADVRFIDTVCRPTRDRQQALRDLCANNDTIVVVGGRDSNNTRQLVETARRLGRRAFQVERPEDLLPRWFRGASRVGVTAGTSTLDETVHEVAEKLRRMARDKQPGGRILAAVRNGVAWSR